MVYLDEIAYKCLHWNGGAPLLLDVGAVAIKEFSAFEVQTLQFTVIYNHFIMFSLQIVPAGCKKAVFITTSAFKGTYLSILKSLVQGSHLDYCVLITSAHVSVHHFLQYGGSKMHRQSC